MSRSGYETVLNCSKEEAFKKIANILHDRKYNEIDYKGDIVWKEGIGMATAMHYIKITFPSDDKMRIFGWVQAGLGSAGLNEMNLHGVLGVVPKKQVKGVLAQIMLAVSGDNDILRNPEKYLNSHDKDALPDLPPFTYHTLGSGAAAAGTAGSLTQKAEELAEKEVPAPSKKAERVAEQMAEKGAELTRFCPKCGNKIQIPKDHPNPFIFCSKCGYKVEI